MNKLGLDPNLISMSPLKKDIDYKLKEIDKHKIGDKKKLKKVCREFEALFIEKLWKEMKKTISQSGLFNDPINSKYLDMFDYTFAMQMAKDGGIGLGDFLYKNLITQLEKKSNQVSTTPKKLERPLSKGKSKDNITIQKQVEDLAKKIEESNQIKNTKNIDLPVSGEITSKYGWRRDPFFGDIRWHNGVDVAAPIGTPIKAVMKGKVIFSGEKPGYGNLVIIKSINGVETYYAHNQENLVKQGETVKKGDIIAKIGITGRTTGPHVHFEVRINNKPIDPLKGYLPTYAYSYKKHKG